MPTASSHSEEATLSRGGSTGEQTSKRLLLGPAWLLAGLAVLALALATTLTVTMGVPAAKGADAPAGTFAAGRALPVLEGLLGDGSPHPIGSAANDAVRERLRAQFAAFGYETTVQEEFVCRQVFDSCGYVSNVLARAGGRQEGKAVLVAAHYDSVAAAPGASDDMAAVAAALEVARMLEAEGPLRNPVIFLISDGEEVGLLGAQAFTDHHPWAGDVGVVVNLEARGSGGRSLLFEAAGGNGWLVGEFADEAPRPVSNSVAYEIYRALPNDTDFTVFREAGMPGINFAYIDGVAHYHTSSDDLSTLSRDSLQHHGDNLLAAVRAFGEANLAERRAGDALFMDLLPGSVAQVPISWALPLSGLVLIAWISLAAVLTRSRRSSAGAAAVGLVAVLAGIVLAGAAAQGSIAALTWATGSSAPWHAVPLPTRLMVWASAAAAALAPVMLLARLAAFWGLTLGVWLAWALVCLALALTLPGASVVFLVPLLVATLLLGVVALAARSSSPALAAATLATAFGTAYLWLPLALLIEQGVGFDSSAGIGVPVALALSAAMPLLAQSRARPPITAGLFVAVLATAAVSGVWATQVPRVTAQVPERMSLVHFQDYGSQTGPGGEGEGDEVDLRAAPSPWERPSAAWLVAPSVSSDVPAPMRRVATFSTERRQALEGSGQAYYVAPAPMTGGGAPRVEILSDTMQDGERLLRLRLVTEQEPLRLELRVKGASVLNEIVFANGETLEFGGRSALEVPGFECNGVRCAGTELTLRLAGPEAVELLLVEHVAGLPEEGAPILAARPPTGVASQDGDVSISSATMRIGEYAGD